MKNKFWLPFIFGVVFVLGMLLGWFVTKQERPSGHGIDKLTQVMGLISTEYVDDVTIDSLVEMTIPQLLKNLDPHSSYISAQNLAAANSELEGSFSGIGISFQILNDTLSVVEVISNGPAEKVGVLPGDRIIKVDDDDIASRKITEDDVFKMLRGEKGSKVSIVVKRSNSPRPITFDIIRDDIPVESVDAVYMLNDKTGYVKVARFGRHTYQEFIQALNKLRLDGAQSFVIDLRGNGGGYMEPAIMMVNEFLPAGKIIVSTKGRNKANDQVILSDGTGAFSDFGVVVLINELTASASEIFSGAIQDNDRGWIVGRRSFGKGLVQSPIMLPDSSEVRLTVQRYYTPSGRCIQKEYKPGDIEHYDLEVINRFNNGEILSADSIKLNIDQKYLTNGGRTVYGGGGIMPDYFVPDDTSHVTSYYINVANQGLLMKYAYEFADDNRLDLKRAKDVNQLLTLLPPDDVLLQDFVRYAVSKGVPARWYYINISSPLIVNQLKALIARNMLGIQGYYEVINRNDKTVEQGIKHASKRLPIKQTDD